MDSLGWSKKYEVLSISRLYLSSLGFTNEQINALTDEDVQLIAEKLNNDYFIGFEEDVKFVVTHELIHKANQATGQNRLQQFSVVSITYKDLDTLDIPAQFKDQVTDEDMIEVAIVMEKIFANAEFWEFFAAAVYKILAVKHPDFHLEG